jgi:hypothetical protein
VANTNTTPWRLRALEGGAARCPQRGGGGLHMRQFCGGERQRPEDIAQRVTLFRRVTLRGSFPARAKAEPPYSITSSAVARSVGGTVRPSAFAVLTLMTIKYFVGNWTGSSDGFAPRRCPTSICRSQAAKGKAYVMLMRIIADASLVPARAESPTRHPCSANEQPQMLPKSLPKSGKTVHETTCFIYQAFDLIWLPGPDSNQRPTG